MRANSPPLSSIRAASPPGRALEPPRDKSPSRATSPGRPISPGPPLLGRYQPVEPRLLGAGRYGPVLRVRDLETNTVVALKVFNAAETWRRHSEPGGRATGVLAGCLSLRDAEAEVLRAFRAEVRWLRRAHESSSGLSSTAVAGLLHYSQDAFGEPTTALDGLCYLVLELGGGCAEQQRGARLWQRARALRAGAPHDARGRSPPVLNVTGMRARAHPTNALRASVGSGLLLVVHALGR